MVHFHNEIQSASNYAWLFSMFYPWYTRSSFFNHDMPHLCRIGALFGITMVQEKLMHISWSRTRVCIWPLTPTRHGGCGAIWGIGNLPILKLNHHVQPRTMICWIWNLKICDIHVYKAESQKASKFPTVHVNFLLSRQILRCPCLYGRVTIWMSIRQSHMDIHMSQFGCL